MGIQHFGPVRIRIRIRIQGFHDKKLPNFTVGKIHIFYIKIATGSAPALKRDNPAFQNNTFPPFFLIFERVIFAHLDPDPVDHNQRGAMRIRIHILCFEIAKNELNLLVFLNSNETDEFLTQSLYIRRLVFSHNVLIFITLIFLLRPFSLCVCEDMFGDSFLLPKAQKQKSDSPLTHLMFAFNIHTSNVWGCTDEK
jgi:hypothetical protein